MRKSSCMSQELLIDPGHHIISIVWENLPRNTRDYLVLTTENKKSCTSVSKTEYLAHENSKSEIRGRSKHKNNSKKYSEIWNKGTWALRG